MVLAGIIVVPECRIEGLIVEVDDLLRCFAVAILLRRNECRLIVERVRPVTAFLPVIGIVREAEDELFGRNVADRMIENAAIPPDGCDRTWFAQRAVFVVRHHDDVIADRRRLSPIDVPSRFEIGTDDEVILRE